MRLHTIIIFTFILWFTSSVNAQLVKFSVGILEPAEISIPKKIGTIIISVRNCNNVQNYKYDVSADQSVAQLKNYIDSTERYKVEIGEISSEYNLSDVNSFPSPLNWAEVGRIVRYDSSALLIVLEKYCQYTISSGTKMVERFWRIYDYSSTTICDEFDQHVKRLQYQSTSSPAVELYAKRIMMHWEWVNRDYFKKGNSQMLEAYHCLDSSNWLGAAQLWKIVADDSVSDPANAGNACYNLALYYEIHGDITTSLDWISRSIRLGNELAVYYGKLIKERAADSSNIRQQLSQGQGKIPLSKVNVSKVYREPKNKLGEPEPRSVPLYLREARRKAQVPTQNNTR